jgi:hypothetical protein
MVAELGNGQRVMAVLVADSERTAIYTNFKAFIQSIVMVPAPRCQRYLSLVAMCVALLQQLHHQQRRCAAIIRSFGLREHRLDDRWRPSRRGGRRTMA